MKKFRNMKKTFAAFMSFVLVATIIPASVFAANEADSVVEKTETLNGTTYTVWDSSIPEDVNLSLEEVDSESLDLEAYEIEKVSDITTAVDIKLLNEDETEWQPDDTVNVSIDAASLGLEDGDTVVIKHNHEGDISSLGEYVVADGKITFETDGFSIYVVTISDNTWNRNNYAIMLSVGDEQDVSVTTNNTSYWSSSDSNVLKVAYTSNQTATVTAVSPGKVTLSKGNQQISVTVVEKAGDDIGDDIIFKNIKVPYSNSSATQITEYANTYGPYVMKVRFEDSAGNLIDVDQDYFVFDSAVPININTFAVAAPEGYTYDGAYFFWNGHTGDNANKIYVTEVTRLNNLGSGGSYLYFDHGTTVNDWYQASGVLHVVYVKKDQSYSVLFEDHEGSVLHSYAIKYKDAGGQIPTDYVQNLQNILLDGIDANHNIAAPGYEFTGRWNVTRDSGAIEHSNITTDRLVDLVPTWRISTNVKVTAICREADATINYVPVTEEGGTVSRSTETMKAISGEAQGSIATAKEGYEFKGWYSDENCTQKVSDDAAFVPAKINGVNVAATYYAKFVEKKVTITYVPVGGGTVDNDTETINKVTGTATGSTPTAKAGYTFEGWYTDQNCETKVESRLVGANNKITPTKEANAVWPDTTTYYAKFVENEAKINYVAETGGAVDKNNEIVGMATGVAQGSTATVIKGYEFLGWYNEKGVQVSTESKFVPTKATNELWPEASTYTAKFKELQTKIIYKAVGPDGTILSADSDIGRVDPISQTLGVVTGIATGSTASTTNNNQTYKFVGWYTDAECQNAVNSNWVDENNKIVPVKAEDTLWTEDPNVLTYYAKFDWNVADLTITKAGISDLDNHEAKIVGDLGKEEHQSSIFRITNNNGYSQTVVIDGNGSVTITGLQVGTYTVTELTDWSWRYELGDDFENDGKEVNVEGGKTNTVTFTNNRTLDKWLNGGDYEENTFAGKLNGNN